MRNTIITSQTKFDQAAIHKDLQYALTKRYANTDAAVQEREEAPVWKKAEAFGNGDTKKELGYCSAKQNIQPRENDGNSTSTQIKIGAEVNIAGLIKANVEWTKAHSGEETSPPNTETAGNRGTAVVGDYGTATAGRSGKAIAGDYGTATAGSRGKASAGDYGGATVGRGGKAIVGDYGVAAAAGQGKAEAGDYGTAVSGETAEVGKWGLAVVRGMEGKAKGGVGSILVICEENKRSPQTPAWIAVFVDGIDIKAETWYMLKNGILMEVAEDNGYK